MFLFVSSTFCYGDCHHSQLQMKKPSNIQNVNCFIYIVNKWWDGFKVLSLCPQGQQRTWNRHDNMGLLVSVGEVAKAWWEKSGQKPSPSANLLCSLIDLFIQQRFIQPFLWGGHHYYKEQESEQWTNLPYGICILVGCGEWATKSIEFPYIFCKRVSQDVHSGGESSAGRAGALKSGFLGLSPGCETLGHGLTSLSLRFSRCKMGKIISIHIGCWDEYITSYLWKPK